MVTVKKFPFSCALGPQGLELLQMTQKCENPRPLQDAAGDGKCRGGNPKCSAGRHGQCHWAVSIRHGQCHWAVIEGTLLQGGNGLHCTALDVENVIKVQILISVS